MDLWMEALFYIDFVLKISNYPIFKIRTSDFLNRHHNMILFCSLLIYMILREELN